MLLFYTVNEWNIAFLVPPSQNREHAGWTSPLSQFLSLIHINFKTLHLYCLCMYYTYAFKIKIKRYVLYQLILYYGCISLFIMIFYCWYLYETWLYKKFVLQCIVNIIKNILIVCITSFIVYCVIIKTYTYMFINRI